MRRGRPKHDDILTPREWQVLDLIREGLTNERIAERLGISESGARYHVSEILSKLGVDGREDAAAWRPERRDARPRRLSALPGLRFVVPFKAAGGAVGIAIGLALLSFALFHGHPSSAVVAGPLGKIAYIQDGNVWVKAVPNGNPQRLTDDGSASHPKWSPSGRWLTYIRTGPRPQFGAPAYETWVLRADGSGRHRLDTAYLAAAGWSPAADRLVYFSSKGSLVVEDADGGNRHEVMKPYRSATEDGGLSAGVAWSPDGRWVAYGFQRWPAQDTRSRSTAGALSPTPGPSPTPLPYPTPTGAERTYAGIWRVSADGGDAREIIRFNDPQTRAILFRWSQDGASLTFLTLPQTEAPAGNSNVPAVLRGLPLYAVQVDSGIVRDLGRTSIWAPFSFSRRESAMALVEGDKAESWTDKSIFVSAIANGAFTRLTGPGVAAISPQWSPDGGSIAYVSSVDPGATPTDAPVLVRRAAQDAALGARRIWVMAADGSNKRQVTNDADYRDEDPQWSTDGRHVLFARLSQEPCPASYSLWLLNVADGKLEQVASALPLFGTQELLQVGDIPRCQVESDWVTESFGYVSFGPVFDWWRGP